MSDYTLTARVNPVNVYAGSPLTIEIDVLFTGPPYDHIHPTLTPSHPDLAASLWCGVYNPACWGSPPYVYNTAQSAKFYVIAKSSIPGSYSVMLTTVASGITHTLNLPVTVLPLPAGIDPPVVPPLPVTALAAYEKAMLDVTSPSTSACRCDPAYPAKYVWSFGVETQAWYYDGTLVYYQIADYTGDPKWKACALSIADAYTAYIMSGSVPGWRVFTQGLNRAWVETRDPKYRDAVQRLITTGSPYAKVGGDPADNVNRETSYMLRAYTDAHLMGLPTDSAAVARSLNWLLGMCQTLFAGPPMQTNALDHQLFMDGLMAEAMSYYYDSWIADPRIPPTLKKMCDWIWTYAWDDTAGKMLWNPFPPNSGYPHHCDSSCQVYVTGLIGLTMPVFWWYWKLSGDDGYRAKGDRMFAHMMDTLPYSGKEFSQQFKWTIPWINQRKMS